MTEEKKTLSLFEKTLSLFVRLDRLYHICYAFVRQLILKYRLFSLICMAVSGIALAVIFLYLFYWLRLNANNLCFNNLTFLVYWLRLDANNLCFNNLTFLVDWLGSDANNLFFNNLTLLGLSLPVLVLLWFYRTHDVQEQIDKAQSNVNTSLLNKGIDLLLTEDTNDNNHVNKRSAGLIMLAKLRQQDETLRPEIDALTPGVKLKNANLQDAQLQGANLRGAILSVADLRGANLEDANLENARYSKNTKFPEGFDPKGAGMEKVGRN